MKVDDLIPDLFRTEYRKIISVLCKRFGFDHIEIAEDIASETFLTAAQTWGLNGLPDHPKAWLYGVAKNKAKNYLHRDSILRNKILPELKKDSADFSEREIDLSNQNIEDSQLQMMFAVCHPSISKEAQIGLSLRILCGFGIEEIADAFLTNKETINKRLFRAKEKLRNENVKIELPDPVEIEERLDSVLTTVYLLFSEGFYSTSRNTTLHKGLSLEAIRLCTILAENPNTNKPQVNALLALMCFHISRFEARLDETGEPILYGEQNTNLWNSEWIAKGEFFLHRATGGNQVSKFHLEAGIAYWHTRKENTKEKWRNVLRLYDHLVTIETSPVILLNRIFALSKVRGKEEAIREAENLRFEDNRYFFLLLGELYTTLDDKQSELHFQKALSLSKTQSEKNSIRKKIDLLRG
ncbi:RNA polymerase sigma factor [Leptospira adleri]|uniref:RNA polymerase subunit sigma n=1 Tax=Leptospira adleri TaxID=2023186 RepID=A0A2M9YM39_9LEPT|nr:sigma-70 family RNA polymerase sigma factor [Leptospira adleri]PJZ52500.1 RNA polymerase subunit sigma [Leptospira adleri]PJZ63671.1 RNA polymerase subunit sigma [Leptospira adleri]